MNGKAFFTIAAACALVAMVSAGGCVSPGPIDAGLVARYQRTMASRGPQRRAAEQGVDMLRPVGTGPELEVATDPKTGKPEVRLTLEQAIQRALANGLEVKVVSYDPAISWEEVVQAAAEFDYTVFGGLRYAEQDDKADPTVLGGHSQVNAWNFGVKQKTPTGAQWQLEWAWVRTWDDSTFRTWPTRHEPSLRFQITQPLLRDAWPDVNLATLRVARLNHRQSLAAFRQKVEERVAEVITRYWQLVQARLDLQIQQELLTKTQTTLKRIVDRGLIDATKVQIKQAEAAVESRKATLIRAQKVIYDVQDELGRLLADKQVNLLGECEVLPVTELAKTKVEVNATDQLVTALRHNAVLEQARLAIDVAAITVRVAKHQTLPRLDLTATAGLQGLGPTKHQAAEEFNSLDYPSYSVGLALEYPLGNRNALAEVRKRQFERLKAITTMQNVADQVAVQINERIRQVNTSFEEIKAQRAAVNAARLQLQALEDTETIRARLSPEFLQVKLQAQETVAAAERAELQATIDYNTALTDLARATGTILDLYRVQVQDVADRPLPTPPPLPEPPDRPEPPASAPTSLPKPAPLPKPTPLPQPAAVRSPASARGTLPSSGKGLVAGGL